MPRPKKSVRKTEQLKVCYTPYEMRLIEVYAKKVGVTRAEFVHDKSLNHKIKNRLTGDEMMIYMKLVGMANNLNQLTRYVHLDLKHLSGVPEMIRKINDILNELK